LPDGEIEGGNSSDVFISSKRDFSVVLMLKYNLILINLLKNIKKYLDCHIRS